MQSLPPSGKSILNREISQTIPRCLHLNQNLELFLIPPAPRPRQLTGKAGLVNQVTWGRKGFQIKLLQMYRAKDIYLHRLFKVFFCQVTKGIQELLGDPDFNGFEMYDIRFVNNT